MVKWNLFMPVVVASSDACRAFSNASDDATTTVDFMLYLLKLSLCPEKLKRNFLPEIAAAKATSFKTPTSSKRITVES